MPNVRINGRLMPALQPIMDFAQLKEKLELIAESRQAGLTQILVNGDEIDLENTENFRLKITDLVQARIESSEELAYESLLLAKQYAIKLRHKITRYVVESRMCGYSVWNLLQNILEDTGILLKLAHQPFELMSIQVQDLSIEAQMCLAELGKLRDDIENSIVLAAHDQTQDANYLFLGKVNVTLSRWLDSFQYFLKDLKFNQDFVQDRLGEQPL